MSHANRVGRGAHHGVVPRHARGRATGVPLAAPVLARSQLRTVLLRRELRRGRSERPESKHNYHGTSLVARTTLSRARSLSLSLSVCVSRAAPCFSLCVCVAWLAFSLRADRDTQLRTTTTHFMFHSTLTGC